MQLSNDNKQKKGGRGRGKDRIATRHAAYVETNFVK